MMRELAGYPLNRAASYFSCGMIALLTRVVNEKISLVFSFLPPRTTHVLELDEMWKPYIANKKNKLWIWKALDRNTRHLIDWQCGGRNAQSLNFPERVKERFLISISQFKAFLKNTESDIIANQKRLRAKTHSVLANTVVNTPR